MYKQIKLQTGGHKVDRLTTRERKWNTKQTNERGNTLCRTMNAYRL